MTCGEGGALLVNDSSLLERAEVVREKGTNRSRFFRGEIDKYTWVDEGSNYLAFELQAAVQWDYDWAERQDSVRSPKTSATAFCDSRFIRP